jgi:CRP-like cAMP-binding protein
MGTRKKTHYQNIVAHFSDGENISYKRDQIVIKGTNDPDGTYLIKKGYIRSYSLSKNGHKKILLIYDEGWLFPLPWALNGGHTGGVYYQAMSDVTLMRYSKDRLHIAMGTNAWLSQEVFKQATSLIGLYMQRIKTLEYTTTRERVIAEILHLEERFGYFNGKEIIIESPITHQDIADSVNMSRETASRCLEKLF